MSQNIKEIQNASLEILKEVIKVCRSEKLNYFLVEGSMLGAVRHKGFIPWDDDIDIAMPREDYEQFVHESYKKLPGYMYIQYYENYDKKDATFPRSPRVCDKRHMIQIHIYDNLEKINSFIDIFVLDGMPEGKVHQRLHYIHLFVLYVFYKFVTAERIGTHIKRSRIAVIGISIAKHLHLGKIFNARDVFEHLDRTLKKYPYKNSDTVIMFGSDYRRKQIVPKAYYGEGKVVPFENTRALIPEQAEKILREIYGNFMEFPPKNERKPKHRTTFLH